MSGNRIKPRAVEEKKPYTFVFYPTHNISDPKCVGFFFSQTNQFSYSLDTSVCLQFNYETNYLELVQTLQVKGSGP